MAEIKKRYIVIGWGFQKEEPHAPYCRAAAIKKDSFNKVPQYEYIDNKDILNLDDIHNVGEIIETTTTY